MINSFFSFNATAPTEIYTLSLHDALPISVELNRVDPAESRGFRRLDERHDVVADVMVLVVEIQLLRGDQLDRKSTRLNSSHVEISYAVFCLKKKKKKNLQ